MNLALKVAGGVIVVLILVVATLRVRKLRRDEMRELSKPVERRLMTPPPSPYAPSRGFRLLDGPIEPARRAEPARPRLETDREYVFSETQMPSNGEVRPTPMRHNENWALSRSARSNLRFAGLRIGAIVLVLALVAGFVGYYVQRHSSGLTVPGASTTTTTSSVPTTTTTLRWPSTFRPTSRNGQTANYRVPAVKYTVVVSGTRGATWTVYQMGPKNTLEWQGSVALGRSESLQMTGNSLITLGSPKNATVTVGGSPVVFPSPLPTTLSLSFASQPPG